MNRINFNYLKNVDHKSIFAYPDLGRLYKSLAKFLKLKIDNIMLSAGADGAIKSVFENFTKKGDGILGLNLHLPCIQYILKFMA